MRRCQWLSDLKFLSEQQRESLNGLTVEQVLATHCAADLAMWKDLPYQVASQLRATAAAITEDAREKRAREEARKATELDMMRREEPGGRPSIYARRNQLSRMARGRR